MMENVTSHDDKVWLQFNRPVDDLLKNTVKILSPLFEPILLITQVQVCDVDEAEAFQRAFSQFRDKA
jgi:hypothetical protein